MKILIQKFGGTSVKNEINRKHAADKIKMAIKEGYSPVVVVSAMGRLGDPYATDTLLSNVLNITNKMDKRSLDTLMACGEIISCNVMCATLREMDIKCTVLTGGQAGIITDGSFGSASVIKVNTDKILKLLDEGIVPVVAGFQGMTENGDFTTLGRGGSDTSAAILGEALHAYEIDIYTDVDGIMTSDPKIVPDARIIDSIGYNEVFQFAEMGAKVIHPKAVEFAMRGNVPLVIKNTMSDAAGTIITSISNSKKRLITGITYMPDRAQILIEDTKTSGVDDETIFAVLAKNQISIDLLSIFPNYKVFTIDEDNLNKAENLLKNLGLKFKINTNCSMISIISERMRGVYGIMASIVKTLKQNNIELLQTSDSHTTVWCLVRSSDIPKALNSLHSTFFDDEIE
jgi:aspartate kinase